MADAVDDLVIAWVAMGLTLKQIAANLKRSRQYVDTYLVRRIEKRRKLRGTAAYTRYAMVNGLIPFK